RRRGRAVGCGIAGRRPRERAAAHRRAGAAGAHRPRGARAAGRSDVHQLPPGFDAERSGRGASRWRRRADRPEHAPSVLPGGDRGDAGRHADARGAVESRAAGHASQRTHPHRRAHDAELPDETAARPDAAGTDRAMTGRRRGDAFPRSLCRLLAVRGALAGAVLAGGVALSPAFVAPAIAQTVAQTTPLGLYDAWIAAREHDAQFRAARHELEAGLLAEPIGRAGLLPNIALSASAARVDGDRSVPTALGSVDQPLDYTSRHTTLQLRQPLYNREAMARYRIGSAQAEYARALFVAAERELAQRVAEAYFEVLLARDVVALAEAQLEAYEEQVKVTTRRLSGGEGTRTEMADAQARASLARAELIAARDRLTV